MARGVAKGAPDQVRTRRGGRAAKKPALMPTLTPEQVERIFKTLTSARPSPRSELNYTTPFELLVAVILSAQSTDRAVNQATAGLYSTHNTPQALLELGEAGLRHAIRTIGLAPTKARNIQAACRLLLERHGGQVPQQREALEALPGVGRKTANVVLNVAFGQPTIAVDTHVFRVSNRTGLAPGRTVLEVEQALLRVVPERFALEAHHQLILHGRYVCTARKPRCGECVIRQVCAWPEKLLEQALENTRTAGTFPARKTARDAPRGQRSATKRRANG